MNIKNVTIAIAVAIIIVIAYWFYIMYNSGVYDTDMPFLNDISDQSDDRKMADLIATANKMKRKKAMAKLAGILYGRSSKKYKDQLSQYNLLYNQFIDIENDRVLP